MSFPFLAQRMRGHMDFVVTSKLLLSAVFAKRHAFFVSDMRSRQIVPEKGAALGALPDRRFQPRSKRTPKPPTTWFRSKRSRVCGTEVVGPEALEAGIIILRLHIGMAVERIFDASARRASRRDWHERCNESIRRPPSRGSDRSHRHPWRRRACCCPSCAKTRTALDLAARPHASMGGHAVKHSFAVEGDAAERSRDRRSPIWKS